MNPQFGMGMGFGMQNMQMPMGMGMGMQGGNGFMNMSNMMDNDADQEWLKGFQMGVEEVRGDNNNDDGRPKTNVVFRTTQGTTTNMIYPHGTIMDKALEEYLSRVGRPDLYRDKSNQICFLYNGSQIKFGEKSKVEVYFKNVNMPKIIVNDVHNLIGAK